MSNQDERGGSLLRLMLVRQNKSNYAQTKLLSNEQPQHGMFKFA